MTMPTIRVDDEVYEALKREAEPFVDTPNTVFRRLLGLDTPGHPPPAVQRSASRRARPGELLDRKTYDLLILRVLDEMGGTGHASAVVEEVGKLVGDQLNAMDHTENNSGIVRWKNRVMWRRLRLVEFGLLKDDSPRGTWEISDAGRDALAAGRIDYP